MATERRAVDVDDGFEIPTAPSSRPLTSSGLQSFASASAFVTFLGRAAIAGDEYYDSTLATRRTYNGTIWVSGADAGVISEKTIDIANNQVAAADVTGLIIDKLLWRSAVIDLDMYRRDTATPGSELRWVGIFRAIYSIENDTWEIQGLQGGSDSVSGKPAGVTLSITAAGQVQYTSHSLAGSNYVGELTYSARMKTKAEA